VATPLKPRQLIVEIGAFMDRQAGLLAGPAGPILRGDRERSTLRSPKTCVTTAVAQRRHGIDALAVSG
jgi:hypothetical protein